MKTFRVLLAAVLSLSLLLPVTAQAAYQPNFQLRSQAAYMENLDTGQVMVEKDADRRLFPGYLAKVMTALVVLDHVQDLDAETTALKLYIQDMVYGSANLADIYNGDQLSIRDLLYAMMLQSANEATLMLADYVGDGSIGHFVDLMNEKAAALGCTDTHFTDPAGVYDPDTYTTARDMSKIAAAVMEYSAFAEVVAARTKTITVVNRERAINLNNYTNGLGKPGGDYYLASSSGIMSSSLAESGRCMVSQASSGGYTYQVVVLGAPLTHDDGAATNPEYLHYAESKSLYLWAFDNFSVRTVVDKGEMIAECRVRYSFAGDHVKVETGEKLTTLMENSLELSSVQYYPELPDYVAAPVEKGQQVGVLRLVLAEEELGTVPLLATESLSGSKFLTALGWLQNIIHSYWGKVLVVLVVLLILGYGWLFVQANRKKKKSRRPRPRQDYHL